MLISDAIHQFTEDLEDFETLIAWCDIFKVSHDEEDALRVKLAEKMERVGK